MTFTLTTYGSGLDKTSYLEKIKTQVNPFTGDIEEYGVSGDCAALLVKALNQNLFSVREGTSNLKIPNCLSINEETPTKNQNDVVRAGSDFYLSGNFIYDYDSNTAANNFIFRMAYVYVAQTMKMFLKGLIFTLSDFDDKIRNKLEEISRNIRTVMKSFEYTYSINGRNLEIELKENFHQIMDKMSINIDYK